MSLQTSLRIKNAFAREVAKEDDQLNLAYAALLFAEYLTEPLDIANYLSLLDSFADAADSAVTTASTGREKVEVLNHFLFENLKFIGNWRYYYRAENSLLHRVLEQRAGIPISLSVVYLEIGWRLGLPVWGIGMPGHFIVGYGPAEEALYIDVFNGGRLLSVEECMKLADGPFSNALSFQEYFLKPVDKKAILYRMLNNLKQIYVRTKAWEQAYHTVDLMLVIDPSQAREVRDRGMLAYRLDRLQAATFDLHRYLFLRPDASDAAWLKPRLEEMEEKLMRLN